MSEVMITLGIVGVVAALTIPVLIQNYKKQETTVRLKNFYSNISQAIVMSEYDNGPIETWENNPIAYDKNGNRDEEANNIISDNFFNKYLAPYLKYVEVKIENQSYVVKLADGSKFQIRNGECYDIGFDVNGEKKPNYDGKDRFYFLICPHTKYATIGNGYFGAYCNGCDTREKALNTCKTTRYKCGGILQYDNWEIRDDYPWRL